MSKGLAEPDENPGHEPAGAQVAVELDAPSAERQAMKVAIALPKDPPPSNYIPMGSHVLVDKLSKRFSPEDVSRMSMLSKRIGLRCALRLEDSFSQADYLYSMFDPDSDPVTAYASTEKRTQDNLACLTSDLETLLEMAGFQPVPEEFVEISKGADRLRGFRVQKPSADVLKRKMYYQRLLPMVIKRPLRFWPWKTEPVEVVQYSCLFTIFQKLPVPEKLSLFQRVRAAVWPAAVAPDGADAALLSEAAPEPPEPPVGLRVFHSVALHNADMLIPGAVARFTFVDKLLIWLPIAIGLCSALYKIFTSGLEFNPKENLTAFATTVALVLMPISYAIQARASLQRKADDYKAEIDELLLMRQRSSNAGALQWLLDTASEQEQKEMLLAYAFLWGGAAEPAPVARDAAKQDVDAAIEQFLSDDIIRAEGDRDQMEPVDFDMADALGDIVREGLAVAADGEGALQAVPLPDAVEAMSIRNYQEETAQDRQALAARHWQLHSKRKPTSSAGSGSGIAAMHAAATSAAGEGRA